jgi:orotate phosphoribosyltransferase
VGPLRAFYTAKQVSCGHQIATPNVAFPAEEVNVDLIPTQEEVLSIIQETGALRTGHFEYRDGIHTAQHLEPALAMRYHQHAKVLSVGLSRLLRANSEIRSMIPDLSIVAATVGGLPVAYGLCEALHARQVYFTEKENRNADMHFPQYVEPKPGERVLLVDDILRSGKLLHEAKALIESRGAEVVAVAVLFHVPTPKTSGFGALPLYFLAEIEITCYRDACSCELCRRGVPLQQLEETEESEAVRGELVAMDA